MFIILVSFVWVRTYNNFLSENWVDCDNGSKNNPDEWSPPAFLAKVLSARLEVWVGFGAGGVHSSLRTRFAGQPNR
jgi:hypothetical protein